MDVSCTDDLDVLGNNILSMYHPGQHCDYRRQEQDTCMARTAADPTTNNFSETRDT